MKEFVISEVKAETAVLVGLITKTQDEAKTKEYLDELEFLADTAGTVTLFILCFNPFFPRIGYLLELLVFEDQSICICMIDGNWLLSANLFCKNLLTQVV